MQSAKHFNQAYQKAQQNKSQTTILPALEQSTRITNTRSVKVGIDKRIPKSVLHELQNTQNLTTLSYQDSNFFITQFGDQRKNGHLRKTASQSEMMKVPKPKQKLEVIMGELGQAINRLKNLRQVQPPKNKIKSSESSFDEKDRPDELFLNEVEKSLKNTRNFNQSDTFEQKNQSMSQMFFKNRSEQINVMQENLTEGLNRFNRVMENVKERERKLFDLKSQLQKLMDEEERVKLMKGQDAGSAGNLQDEIDYFQNKMFELKMERTILNNMKSTRKRDIEIIKMPYYKDRDVLEDLNIFLEKETEHLVDDAKQIDNIRTALVDQKQDKKKLEIQSVIIMRDQEIHKRNEDNQDKVIEQEIEYSKFQQELKINQRKEREKQLQEQKRQVYAEQQVLNGKLQDLKNQFQEIASKLPVQNHPAEIIDQFDDLKETNVYLKKRQELQVQIMKQTRTEIINMQELLLKLRNEGCTVQNEDRLQVEMDEISQEKLESQLNDQIFQNMKAKQDQFRSHRLLTDIKKGFVGILEEFQYSSLSKSQLIKKDQFGLLSVGEMCEQVQKMVEVLFEQLKHLDISEQDIEQRLQQTRTYITKRQKEVIQEKAQKNFSEKEIQDDEQSDSNY